MDGAERLVGAGGDDCPGLQLFPVRPGPGLPQAGEGERLARCRMHVERPLAVAGFLPFVEAVSRNEATPPFHGGAVGRFVADGFAARVDQQREGLGILDPGRQQAPAHQREPAFAVDQAHDGDRLRRGDIVARREIGLLLVAKQRPQRFRIGDDRIAAAHFSAFPQYLIAF